MRDEMMTAYMMYDVVMWPVYAAVSSLTVLEARWLGLLLRLVTALAWYLLMKRYADPLIVALAATAVSTPFLTYWEPGYDLLGSHLVLLGSSLWLHSFVTKGQTTRMVLAAVGGFLFSFGMVADLPLIVAFGFPVAVLLASSVVSQL